MQLHELKRKTPNKKSRRVGRGGTRGKTSGRGTKGQKARAGHRIRPEFRDMIKKIPKRRGYGKHRSTSAVGSRVKALPVDIRSIEKAFAAGETVTITTLAEKKLIRMRGGKAPAVKILGTGVVSKKLSVSGVPVSAKVKEAIEKAGGSVE
ncbi:MAG: 50S ribosomal protein L15 [Candidatus Campbellbacteria bacterium]